MRAGVKFGRNGAAAYMSHLDMQRMVGRLLRRTGLPVKYSEGFNPHVILSFASALPVGTRSNGDYFEFGLEAPIDMNELLALLKAQAPPGIDMLQAGILPEQAKKLMAAVYAQQVSIVPIGNQDAFFRAVCEIDACESLIVRKQTKKQSVDVDIKPMIYGYKRQGNAIQFTLAHSSSSSLNPALILEAASGKAGMRLSAVMTRDELFYKEGKNCMPLHHLFSKVSKESACD
jgi:radical SAM-linked protein